MNRSEFIDYLLEKGKCNRFDESQIDAIEQFCFELYESTELNRSIKRIAELEQENQVFKQQWHELNDSIEHQLKKGDAILKLEQQAKGVDWVIACRELNLSQGEVHTLMDKCNKLREQAKQLKEHKGDEK